MRNVWSTRARSREGAGCGRKRGMRDHRLGAGLDGCVKPDAAGSLLGFDVGWTCHQCVLPCLFSRPPALSRHSSDLPRLFCSFFCAVVKLVRAADREAPGAARPDATGLLFGCVFWGRRGAHPCLLPRRVPPTRRR